MSVASTGGSTVVSTRGTSVASTAIAPVKLYQLGRKKGAKITLVARGDASFSDLDIFLREKLYEADGDLGAHTSRLQFNTDPSAAPDFFRKSETSYVVGMRPVHYFQLKDSNEFSDYADSLAWSSPLSASPLCSGAVLTYHYDLGGGVPHQYIVESVWSSTSPPADKVSLAASPTKKKRKQNVRNSPAAQPASSKRQATGGGASASSSGDSKQSTDDDDKWLDEMYPALARHLKYGGVMDIGVGCSWDQRPHIALSDCGGNVAEYTYPAQGKGVDLWMGLEQVDEELRQRFPWTEYQARQKEESKVKGNTYRAWSSKKLFPRFWKWVSSRRPQGYITMGRRPGEPFLQVIRGHCIRRPKQCRVTWSSLASEDSITAMFNKVEENL